MNPTARRSSGHLLAALALSLALGAPLHAAAHETRAAKSGAGPALSSAQGKASFYGRRFHGRKTASGRKFNMNALVAAHPRWPFGTVLRVTNLRNKRTVNVEVVDRGPAKSAQRKGVIIDLSRRTAEVLDFIKQGKTDVRLDVLAWGKGRR